MPFLELPHVMLLIDDPDKTVIEPLAGKLDSFEKVYDFELMMNGGHIRGYRIDDGETLKGILKAIEALQTPRSSNPNTRWATTKEYFCLRWVTETTPLHRQRYTGKMSKSP